MPRRPANGSNDVSDFLNQLVCARLIIDRGALDVRDDHGCFDTQIAFLPIVVLRKIAPVVGNGNADSDVLNQAFGPA